MIDLWIDDQPVQAQEGNSVLQAALSAGIEIAHFCSDCAVRTARHCGLCLVRIEGEEGLVFACRTPVRQGMKVLTHSDQINDAVRLKAAELFGSHPADCGVCVKAGDCAIQKICAKYRPDIKSKTTELKKRKLLNKINVTQDKCIQCGRCTAFLRKCGFPVSMETMPPVVCPDFLLSGTLVDLCPAAALTDATQKKLIRSWETVQTQSVDVTDIAGSPIKIETYQGEIIRVHSSNAATLISDKIRFCFDGLRINRLDRPYARIDGRLKECSWTEAFVTIASKMKSVPAHRMAALVGGFSDCESMLALKDLFALLEADAIDARPDPVMYFDLNSRQSWLFNTPFERIKEADALLTIGARICDQSPEIGFLLRQNRMPKAFIGDAADADLDYEFLGNSPQILKEIADGSGTASLMLKRARHPMIVVSDNVLQRQDAPAIMDMIYQIAQKYNVIREDWNGYNFVSAKVGLTAALELKMVSQTPLKPKIKKGEFDFVYLLNEENMTRADLGGAFTVYQGIYASAAAQEADVILPSLAFTEKRATYVNAEGRAQSTAVVCAPFGMAREDWKILRALSEYLETAPLPYDDLDDVRDYLAGENMIFYQRGEIARSENIPFGVSGQINNDPIKPVENVFDEEIYRQSENAALLKKEN